MIQLLESFKAQIIETLLALFAFVVARLVLRHFVNLTLLNFYFKKTERKDVLKLIYLLLFVFFCILIVSIWSVKQENILLIASSMLTVFGVAMFAEMSILSNVTACLILFFQHPIKIGDIISVHSEGTETEGELVDITYFFVFIKTADNKMVTVPNAMLLKNSFTIIDSGKENPEKPQQ